MTMKTAKLELNFRDASTLYRGLAAYELMLKADKDVEPSVVAMCIADLEPLKDKLALIFEKTRPVEKKR